MRPQPFAILLGLVLLSSCAIDASTSEGCGDGLLTPPERCDVGIEPGLLGACPLACSDGIACTADRIEGESCQAACAWDEIVTCVDGDGCCPGGCDAARDSDCSTSCGDGSVGAMETCDTAIRAGDPGACPSECDDGIACTTDRLVGSACSASCSASLVSACVDGDGCCPSDCDSTTDADCSPTCGNGTVEALEACDTAIPDGEAGACPRTCNDGIACTNDQLVGSGCAVSCSAGPITDCASGDGCCPSACDTHSDGDCSPTCGNGTVEPPETCDTGIASGAGACPSTCDDGLACTLDRLVGSGCSASCSASPITMCAGGDGCCPSACNALTDSDCSPTCGNGAVEPPELCDTAIASGAGSCPSTCSDGLACTLDRIVGSGCATSCSFTAISACSGGDGCCPSACTALTDSDCSPVCGNGAVEAPERCDTAIAAGRAGACPTSCDDGDACTADALMGSACNAYCDHAPDPHPEIWGDAIDQDCDGYLRPVLSCTGIRVPGDYATISAALSAIEAGTAVGFICLGEGVYHGDLRAFPSTRNVAIVGVNADVTRIQGHIEMIANATTHPTVEIAGVTVTGGIHATNAELYVHDAVVRGTSTSIGIYAVGTGSLTALRTEVSGTPTTDAIQASSRRPSYVRNCYLHDARYGVAVSTTTSASSSVLIENNTILDMRTGILGYAFTGGGSYALTYRNNIIARSTQYAVDLSAAPTAHSNNALFGNMTNYNGLAGAGLGYVTSDPRLDTSYVPPVPGSTSPLLGAASSSAPADDYWRVARDAAPDIGAVERTAAH